MTTEKTTYTRRTALETAIALLSVYEDTDMALLDKLETILAAENKSTKETKKQIEAKAFAHDVLDWITATEETGEPIHNKDIAAAFEVSPQKASAAVRHLIKCGHVVRVPAEKSTGHDTFVTAQYKYSLRRR